MRNYPIDSTVKTALQNKIKQTGKAISITEVFKLCLIAAHKEMKPFTPAQIKEKSSICANISDDSHYKMKQKANELHVSLIDYQTKAIELYSSAIVEELKTGKEDKQQVSRLLAEFPLPAQFYLKLFCDYKVKKAKKEAPTPFYVFIQNCTHTAFLNLKPEDFETPKGDVYNCSLRFDEEFTAKIREFSLKTGLSYRAIIWTAFSKFGAETYKEMFGE